ncbi:MAG: hypothetical protein GY757_02435 [bacterium]|nr:hypothetical protein [bacterium]
MKEKNNDKKNIDVIENFYKERLETIGQEIQRIKKRSTILAFTKLFMALTAAALVLMHKISPEMLSFMALLFIITAVFHERVIRKQKAQKRLKQINEEELQYLHHEFPNPESGENFSDGEHNYTSDLDIFVKRGLYQFINRAGTILGKTRLADWLKSLPAFDEPYIKTLRNRQDAVKELAENIDFRQAIRSCGMTIDDSSKKLDSLYNLFKEPFFMLGKNVFTAIIYIWPILTLAAFAGMFVFDLSWVWCGSSVTLKFIVNMAMFKKVSRVYLHTSRYSRILKTYSNIIGEIERQPFKCDELKRLQGELLIKSKPASFYIKKLATLMEWFDLRRSGSVHFILTNTMFWDLHLVLKIEKWRKEITAELNHWLDVIGEMDALCSFGTLSFNYPHWTMPGFSTQFKLNAESMGHPLIAEEERVYNDIHLERKGDILIVTGPNMAGKSTFLRTVGVNMVLAYAGAPVCADHFEVSLQKLYTSMKISDSLDKKMSLFYAELLRLKKILDGILKKEPVFFIIDEMLKGTNTEDRRKGAIALIKQMLANSADGIVATHDLGLAKLEKEYPQNIINYHFDSYIENDKLLFDYKLKHGVCQSFNALILMEKMGIKI